MQETKAREFVNDLGNEVVTGSMLIFAELLIEAFKDTRIDGKKRKIKISTKNNNKTEPTGNTE